MMEHSKKKHCEEGYKEPVVVTSSFEAHGQHGEANGESPAALPKCDPNSCGESPMMEHSKKTHQHDGPWIGVKTGGPISCGLPPTRDNTNSIPVAPGVEVVTKAGPFDCPCYNDRYPDLQNAFKGDCGKLTNHYLTHGLT